jgi:hypothetical protein
MNDIADGVPRRTALSYARPGADDRSPVRERYARGVAAAAAVPAAMTVYCHLAARLCQAWLGQGILCEGVTGTKAFELWLIEIPVLAATGWAVAVMLAVALMRPKQMLPPSTLPALWVVVCPTATITWMLFLIACLPIWDDIAP